jgi:chaperonin cofactor prefoldin
MTVNIDIINKKEIDEILDDINTLKKTISLNFIEIGIRLKKIRDNKLYLEKGFKNFFDFIKNSSIDLSPIMVERFISVAEDNNIKNFAHLDINKLNELMKIDSKYREKLLLGTIKVNGEEKKIDDLSLSQIKKISQQFKREGKFKCDRCGRWVENVKELDGKMYGTGNKHSCYDKEIEERRYIEENPIPAAQLDNVLNQIKTTINNVNQEIETASLSESIYKIYGQFLYQHKINSEELTIDSLEKEKEIIEKFINLLKNRLRDIKDTINLISKEI